MWSGRCEVLDEAAGCASCWRSRAAARTRAGGRKLEDPQPCKLQGDEVYEMRLKLLSSSPESYPFKDDD